MILSLLLCAQLAVATDSIYSSSAVRALVARAATENHAPPPSFSAYKAHVESELSLMIRDTLGRENAAQIEQFASQASWVRGADYEVHVVGYRSQGVGVPYSALSFITGWTVPSLYGERLRLGVIGPASADSQPRGGDPVIAVHPFAADRERYYRFSGGDTVGVLHTVRRTITIVRIHVESRLPDSARVAAFDGDIQLDAERGQIVRMRGQFVVHNADLKRSLAARVAGVVGIAYSDFVNAEIDGRYWLPASQRTEFQASVSLLGRTRAVMRVLSEFSDFEVTDSSLPVADQHRIAHVTTWAPTDSIAQFNAWRSSLGTITSSASAGDFDDIAPDIWRPTGAPRFDFSPAQTGHLVGFDRIGGLFTGLEGTLHLRDAAPGVTLGANAGWAWTERVVRGGAYVSRQRNGWGFTLAGERRLVTTNDFLRPLEPSSGGLGAFLGSVDDFDYVERRRAFVSATRFSGASEGLVTLQLGLGRDENEVARLTRGIIGSTPFRANRSAESGSYRVAALMGEWHPSVSGDFVHPGVGGRLLLEAAEGQLAWRRAEASVSARQYVGPITVAFHADGGTVGGAQIPPQYLYELGGTGSLFGYHYKQFVGNRAALFRSYASYTLPLWRTPRHVFRNFYVPGLAPGVAIGVTGGWSELTSSAAVNAAAALNALPRPLQTNGVRGTVGGGLTLFGGNLHLGVARAVDRAAPWKFAVGLGQEF